MCAVRPATLYGRGEDTHFPRTVLLFEVGEPRVKIDWIYVDNLELALILQARTSRQPYFVFDDKRINSAVLCLMGIILCQIVLCII